MADELTHTLKLRFVKSIDSTDNGHRIEFVDGTVGEIPPSHKKVDYFVKILQKAKEGGEPVGTEIGKDGKVVRIDYSDRDIPKSLTDDPANKRIKVWFHGHQGTYSLQYNHPEHKALKLMLNERLEKKQALRLATGLPKLTIDDAIVDKSQVDPTKK